MLIWIFTELAIIGYSWLQSLYFGLGALELILAFALLGFCPGNWFSLARIAGNEVMKHSTSFGEPDKAGLPANRQNSRTLQDGTS